MNKLVALLLLLGLGACSTVERTMIAERPKPTFPEPQAVNQDDYQWMVITKANFEDRLKSLQSSGGDFVIFAVTPEGYQTLNLNQAELRKYIEEQNVVIKGYQEYVQGPKEEGKKLGWFRILIKNK